MKNIRNIDVDCKKIYSIFFKKKSKAHSESNQV
jgi:hypothetical protein